MSGDDSRDNDRDSLIVLERTGSRPIVDGGIAIFGAMVFLVLHLIGLLALIWNGSSPVYVANFVSLVSLIWSKVESRSDRNLHPSRTLSSHETHNVLASGVLG